MAQQTTFRFDLTKVKTRGIAKAGSEVIKSFHMREVTGVDEEHAANVAKGKGGSATNIEELTRLAIVAVNDKAVPQPYLAFDHWNSKARAFALKAFGEINSITQEESESFAGTAEVAEVPLSVVADQSATG